MELGHAIQDLGPVAYRFEPGPDGNSVMVASVFHDGLGWVGTRHSDANVRRFPSREDAIRWLDAPRLAGSDVD